MWKYDQWEVSLFHSRMLWPSGIPQWDFKWDLWNALQGSNSVNWKVSEWILLSISHRTISTKNKSLVLIGTFVIGIIYFENFHFSSLFIFVILSGRMSLWSFPKCAMYSVKLVNCFWQTGHSFSNFSNYKMKC